MENQEKDKKSELDSYINICIDDLERYQNLPYSVSRWLCSEPSENIGLCKNDI